ncbi:MAG: MarR family transcriptional regulator [Acidimicrobiia bacterium]|nr:MarR family transcriptional regulator [Acidimicrobiia bacterium]
MIWQAAISTETMNDSGSAHGTAPTGGYQAVGHLDDQLCFALYAASNAVTRAYRPLLASIGLTYPQYLVLLILWEHRSRQVGEIAASLQLATHAVSPIVDRLEEADLVRRTRDGADGRVVRVELTEAGTELEAAAAEVQEKIRCQTSLEDSEVVRLRAELHNLIERMGG